MLPGLVVAEQLRGILQDQARAIAILIAFFRRGDEDIRFFTFMYQPLMIAIVLIIEILQIDDLAHCVRIVLTNNADGAGDVVELYPLTDNDFIDPGQLAAPDKPLKLIHRQHILMPPGKIGKFLTHHN